jgi:ribonuclease HII
VCAASVVLKETRFDRKIADSKLLSPRSRDLAYEEITRKAWIGMGSVSHDLIDKINIYNATILAMTRAVKNLDIQPDMLLIDGRIRLSVPWAQKSIVRGDSQSLSIACASIVAKVTRDRMMVAFDKAYPEYGFARHKGYPTREHVRRLRKCGPCPIHRVSFNPVKQVLTASHGRLD